MEREENLLLQALQEKLPNLKFEAWYPNDFFSRLPLTVRAIQTNTTTNKTMTFDRTIARDAVDGISNFADTLAHQFGRGLEIAGVEKYRQENLNSSDLEQIIMKSLPPDKHEKFSKGKWVADTNYMETIGETESNKSIGIVAATTSENYLEHQEVVVAYYYPSGIIEIYFYPNYFDVFSPRMPLIVENPVENGKIISRSTTKL